MVRGRGHVAELKAVAGSISGPLIQEAASCIKISMLLTLREARSLAEQALEASGYSAGEAQAIADHLIDCELRGLQFGGLPRALSIIERVRATPEAARPISVIHETPLSVTIDGGDQVGYLVANYATDLAIEKASTSGVAVVGANQTWYTGMFSYYLERVTGAGLVGMAAGSGGHFVAPFGSNEARFGTNPIAFGFPSDGHPVIWDIGTAEIMLAEVLLAHRLEQELPVGVAYDKDGRATRTPLEVFGGAVTVWGGHRGSGLALVVQLLGMMTGASAAPDGLSDCGFFLLAVDPEMLVPGGGFRSRVAEYATSVRAARAIEQARPVRMPFDRSAAERARRLAEDRLEIPDEVHAGLIAEIEKVEQVP
jgi:LDH2 family malate/lactate/ureidoglycolate dehydrogenase